MPTIIQPSTTLHILRSVPLDSSYTDTLDFSSVSEQTNFFLSKAKYTYVQMTPVRMQNKIRVAITADHLYDCNYLMFNNANYEGKWFYAFITQIDFINTNLSEISYELDVWQSWWPNIKIHPSFVEREHTNDDSIGANLVPESLEMGEYIYTDQQGTGRMGDYVIIMAATVDAAGNDSEGQMNGGIYSGLTYTQANVDNMNDVIKKLVADNKQSAIVSIFMMPQAFSLATTSAPASYNISISKNYGSIDGYSPKNNKLFTYPYNLLYVTNLMGNSAEFRYEDFSTSSCTFELVGDLSCHPTVILYPENYKGVANNYNEKITLDGFPICEYNTDAFKAWLAQNGANMAVNALGSTAAIWAGGMTMNPMAIMGGIGGLAGMLAQVSVANTLPPQASGAQGSYTQVAAGFKDFYFMRAHIKAEFAKIIDDYFSLEGYATHRVKVPNIKGRESWNYVKTYRANITGSVPFGDIVKIKQMFDHGVTFWHGDYVGDYTRSNKIVR